MLVVTDRLTKRYGGLTALEACSFGVQPGEVFGILGPNGSGKTTLLRLLLGFLYPTAGRATIDGFDCQRDSLAVRSRLSYLPGEVRLPRRIRGRDVVDFFSRIRATASRARALALAERFGLDLSRQVARSSTGMRQMLALSVALSIDVPLLVLDEPTSNLDPTVRAQVLDQVRAAKRDGRTVILSSHVLSEVEEVCDRVVLLRRGSLVHEQQLSTLKNQHRIRARLSGPLGALPAEIQHHARLVPSDDGWIEIEVHGELRALLSWLATMPIADLRIEPLGLRTIYDRVERKAAHG